jgi:hypothetical protein
MAQHWEIGAAGGFGWYADPTINNTAGSVQAGLKPSVAFGVTSDQDMYNYIGGELRYTFRSGQPELKSHGTVVSGGGYTNVVTYELLVYTSPRESKIRPFVAGGAGIKVYTSTNKAYANQPLGNFALLTHVNQVEPAISAGGGVNVCFQTRRVRLESGLMMRRCQTRCSGSLARQKSEAGYLISYRWRASVTRSKRPWLGVPPFTEKYNLGAGICASRSEAAGAKTPICARRG